MRDWCAQDCVRTQTCSVVGMMRKWKAVSSTWLPISNLKARSSQIEPTECVWSNPQWCRCGEDLARLRRCFLEELLLVRYSPCFRWELTGWLHSYWRNEAQRTFWLAQRKILLKHLTGGCHWYRDAYQIQFLCLFEPIECRLFPFFAVGTWSHSPWKRCCSARGSTSASKCSWTCCSDLCPLGWSVRSAHLIALVCHRYPIRSCQGPAIQGLQTSRSLWWKYWGFS